jgi:hypothetical protein
MARQLERVTALQEEPRITRDASLTAQAPELDEQRHAIDAARLAHALVPLEHVMSLIGGIRSELPLVHALR